MATPKSQKKRAPGDLKRLVARFPVLLNPQNPIPLAVGIIHPLTDAAHAAGLDMCKTRIRRAIGFHVSRLAYLKALTQPEARRHGVDLWPGELVTPEQQERAREDIIRIMPVVQERRKLGREKAAQRATGTPPEIIKGANTVIAVDGKPQGQIMKTAPIGLFDPLV